MKNSCRALFHRLPATQRVLESLRAGRPRAAGGLWGGSAALLVACLRERHAGPILIVVADDEAAADFEDDLATFFPTPVHRLGELALDAEGHADPATVGSKLEVLHAVAHDASFTVIASIASMIDPVPRPRALAAGRITLRAGTAVSQHELLERALAAGLRRVPVVLAPGEVSQRGDVLDLFPLGSAHALRLLFFDEELESLRSFDPGTQLSLAELHEAEVALGAPGQEGHVLEHLGRPDLLIVQHEPLRIEDRRQSLMRQRIDARLRLQGFTDTTAGLVRLDVSSLPSHDLDFKILSAGSAAGSGEADPVGRLHAIRGIEGEVHLVCRTQEEADRIAEIFRHKNVSLADERVHLEVGALSRGFRVPELALTVVSNVEFAGVPQAVRARTRVIPPSKAVRSFFELGPGDLVVHAAHGIARFEGIERVERGASAEDHLVLTFRNDVRLLVPASKIHLVQKYVGAGGGTPNLDRLGGKGFARRKQEVTEALFDLAADLLEVQSKRALLLRRPYPRDPLEQEFLDGFPFQDTPDQAQSWREIRADLEQEQVMDRLLCGDVGFGKTELAMRAAFKVAITGRQVAVLVPTTVLAEQHGATFTARFQPHGLEVAVLSRYRKASAATDILRRVYDGRVDVLIGTHRILGSDVKFKDLGLVIVDEEQRFGVRHKEHLKQLRNEVDVLTLSATPIPRTLHGAMLGIRGISTLHAPPPGRQEVETRVAWWDPILISEALHRELARGGQVFVLHNRIESLPAIARAIADLAPEARIAVGHGQMSEAEMERTVRSFIRGDVDVLVSTTIVENGLDLPRANTILIDRADRFGLAELHQLRGRVGRSARKAYCFLLLDRSAPPSDEARKRLKAIEELAHLGAGFAIAMKDLEIRGAGNLLGPQQSGHIAAVGYEMYCELLRGAVDAARTKSAIEPVLREVDVDMQVHAYLPAGIAEDPKERLELLREMDGAVDAEATQQLARSLVDRFGELPPPMTTLLEVFLVKHALLAHGVLGVQFTGEDRVVVRHPPGEPLGGAWLDFFDVRQVEAGKTHLVLPRRKGAWTGERVLTYLLESLLGRAAVAKMRTAWHSPARKRRSPG
jgi:transcription-repair coupling factor (superfamily II helicase)